MRGGLYSGYDPHYVCPAYVLGIALGSFVVGAYLLAAPPQPAARALRSAEGPWPHRRMSPS